MRSVGVRELREKTSQILKDVAEKGETVQVTHHGRVMARLVPPPRKPSREEIERTLERARDLMRRIGEQITEPTCSSTLMREERARGNLLFEASWREDGVIELRPRAATSDPAAWFWSERWQQMEREVQASYDRGDHQRHNSDEQFLGHLERR